MIAAHQSPGMRASSISSLILAALSLSSRWTVLPMMPNTSTFLVVSMALCVAWFTLVSVSIAKHGKRSLWLLVGGPLVMWWPAVIFWLRWSCSHGYECL
jgi:hypothetical protein